MMRKGIMLVALLSGACGSGSVCDEAHGYVAIDVDTCGVTAPQTWTTLDELVDAAMVGHGAWESTPLDGCGVRTARSDSRALDATVDGDRFTLLVVDGSWGASGCGDLHDCESRALEGATACRVEGRFSSR